MVKYRSLLLNLFICFFLMFVAGVAKFFYPSELVWDLSNYHYYNAWALMHNRLGYDIAPAMLHTYFNPLLDIPYYFILNIWGDDAIVNFLQGSFYGILAFIYYKITTLFFNFKKEPIAFLCTIIIGITGFAALSQAGTSSNEVQVSLLILWGFYIILKYIHTENRKNRVWVYAGLLMGSALGLKPTVITYCIAMGISLIVCKKTLKVSFKEIVIFAICGLLGYLIVNGWWMWQLYSHFDNPFFPFLNKIFKSEYFDFINLRDTVYVDKTTWWQKLFLPLTISFLSLKEFYVGEVRFFDLRYALVYLIGLFMFIRWLCRDRKLPEKKYILLYVFLVLSYLIWAYLFSIIRYSIPLGMLSAIIIVKFFQKITGKTEVGNILWLSVKIIGTYILLSEIPNYLVALGPKMPFMSIERINLPENALVRVYGNPVGMVAARLVGDQSNRIVSYVNGNYVLSVNYSKNNKFTQQRSQIEQAHQGPIVSLISYNIYSQEQEVLVLALQKRRELEKQGMYCRALYNYIDVIDICVPQELKEQIFIEPERHRSFEIRGKSNKAVKDSARTYLNELNKVVNPE